MLLVFAMKCTKMPCPLPHNQYCCLLSLPICLPHLLICTCLISSPIACPPSSVLRWCLLRFLFLIYATFLCDSILDCLCTYFWLIGFCVSPLLCLCCFHSVVSVFINLHCHFFSARKKRNKTVARFEIFRKFVARPRNSQLWMSATFESHNVDSVFFFNIWQSY